MTEPALVVPPLDGPPPTTPAGPLRALDGEALGTVWILRWAGPPIPRSAVEAVFADAVAQMSAWDPASALSRFNTAPAGAWVALPAGLVEVLRAALKLAEATNGAFDPTVGAAADTWGFGPSGPIDARPDETPVPLGWRRLRLDGGGRAFQPGGLALDVSGIGKGWVVDRLAGLCRRRAAASWLCEVGGEFSGSGLHPEGRPWLVALEPPRTGAPSPSTVALHRGALATSGDYRRFALVGGVRRGHTLDPRTGEPAETDVVSATVWARSCMEADALATALTVMGCERGLAWADAQGVAALLTDAGLQPRASRVWSAMAEA